MLKMFPSKSMVDYVGEMNKLFSHPSQNDTQPYNMSAQSPFNQSAVNRSSSSTDSTSPDSFPELAIFQPDYRPEVSRSFYDSRHIPDSARPIYDTPKFASDRTLYETPRLYEQRPVFDTAGCYDMARPICETPRPICDTPRPDQFFIRRQRPIMGRKYTKPDNFIESSIVTPITKIPEDFEFPSSIWQDDGIYQRTPPSTSYMEQRNNVYELFPTENRGYEFKTPVKSTNISPSFSNISPSVDSPSFTSPSKMNSPQSFSYSPPCTNALVPCLGSPVPSSSYSQVIRPGKMCSFCRKNGETPIVYMTHWVRERVKNRSIVTCPILRSHVCSTCGATGDDAHTITYCPVLRSNNNGVPLQSTTITLKNTRIKSNGRRRY